MRLFRRSEMSLPNAHDAMKQRMIKVASLLAGAMAFFALCTLQYIVITLTAGLLPVGSAGWSALIRWVGFAVSLVPVVKLHLTAAVYVWALVYSLLLWPRRPFVKIRKLNVTTKSRNE
jgi:hypothetical protein